MAHEDNTLLNAPLLPAPDPEVGHWGGLFGVRESEELISGRTSGGSENNDSGRLSTPQGGLGKALHFLALTLPPGAQCDSCSVLITRLTAQSPEIEDAPVLEDISPALTHTR